MKNEMNYEPVINEVGKILCITVEDISFTVQTNNVLSQAETPFELIGCSTKVQNYRDVLGAMVKNRPLMKAVMVLYNILHEEGDKPVLKADRGRGKRRGEVNKQHKPRQFKEKKCNVCGEPFIPTGPTQKTCEPCKLS